MESNYQLSRIHNYVNGLMSKEEMHTLEREALEDPFLQDAIEGYALQRGVDAKQLSLLQKRLATRVEEQTVGRNRRFYNWQRLAVGATAAVMFVTVCILLLIKFLPQQTAGLAEVEIMQDQVFSISIEARDKGIVRASEWKELEDYLNKNFSSEIEKEGTIVLQVTSDSSGDPIHVEVMESTLPDTDKLVDLIYKKKGIWNPGEVEFTIKIQKVKM